MFFSVLCYNEKYSREKRKLLQSKALHDHVCGMCIDDADMIQENKSRCKS